MTLRKKKHYAILIFLTIALLTVRNLSWFGLIIVPETDLGETARSYNNETETNENVDESVVTTKKNEMGSNLDFDEHLSWFQEQRNKSQDATMLEEPVRIYYRTMAGLGHQFSRISAIYHMAKMYKIPRIYLTANPQCGGDIFTIYNYLIGPGPIIVNLPFSKVDDEENLSQHRRELGFPALAIPNEYSYMTNMTNMGNHSASNVTLEYLSQFKRDVYVANDVPGYSRVISIDHIFQDKEAIKNSTKRYGMKELTDHEVYQQLMLLFKQKHQDRIQKVLNATNFDDHTVFALHVRAGNGEKGDFQKKQRGIVNIDQWIQNVMELLCDYSHTYAGNFTEKPLMVYVGTDTASVIQKFKDASLTMCKIPIVSAAQEYPVEGGDVSFKAKYDSSAKCLEGWESMFLDMYFFTRSNSVIAGKYSSFTQTAPLSYVMEKAKRNSQLNNSSGHHPHLYCEIGKEGDSWECFDTLTNWMLRDKASSFGNIESKRQHRLVEIQFPTGQRSSAIEYLFRGTALQRQAESEV